MCLVCCAKLHFCQFTIRKISSGSSINLLQSVNQQTDKKSIQCTSVHILLRAQMRAQIQRRVSGCASVHLLHNNILVKSCVVIDKSKRARKAVIYHLDACSLLSLLVILYSRTRTGVLNERRHIGSVGLLRASYHCY
jgi:hypothetical protein